MIPAAAGQLRLLVVDDQVDVADSLALLLENMGHETTVAHDGYQALEQFDKTPCDAVLLDIGLPELDGYEIARRLRATTAGEATSLIALTGWGSDDDRHQSLVAGFDHHLVKPVDPDTLEALLAGL